MLTVDDGHLLFTQSTDEDLGLATPTDIVSGDARVSVRVKRLAGDLNHSGVVFRANKDVIFMFGVVDGLHVLWLTQVINGSLRAIIMNGFTPSEAIQREDWNTLTAEIYGDSLRMSVNDMVVYAGVHGMTYSGNPGFQEGQAGVYVFDQQTVAFDDLVVQDF